MPRDHYDSNFSVRVDNHTFLACFSKQTVCIVMDEVRLQPTPVVVLVNLLPHS